MTENGDLELSLFDRIILLRVLMCETIDKTTLGRLLFAKNNY